MSRRPSAGCLSSVTQTLSGSLALSLTLSAAFSLSLAPSLALRLAMALHGWLPVLGDRVRVLQLEQPNSSPLTAEPGPEREREPEPEPEPEPGPEPDAGDRVRVLEQEEGDRRLWFYRRQNWVGREGVVVAETRDEPR